ncbi:hypothetical protein NW768_003774 [Fusarium equiseti]|uniref:Gfd2/YDR514C-like C-terminal domain-containing protein n=1 Tax=Fusarium equiseti TaxID=61235 RepID=A0ABQ8RJA4_FUSEQ|nr:hypothetical protein NW768_003774 [Fusarium equiseti]
MKWTKAYFQELVPPISETTVSEILPFYDPATGSYTVPRDEPVLVSIDFESLCWFATGTYPENHPMNGLYKYSPITEIGWTLLDTRDFTKLKTPPGDRAVDIFKTMKSSHYIINEFRGHFDGKCGNYHETEPYNFAFGKSKYIPTEDIPKILIKRLEQVMKPRNLTKRERDENIPRNIVFLTWAPDLEICTLERFGLD